MAQEVSKLQNANRRLERNCLSGDSSVRTVFKTVEITKYKLKEESDEFCQDLIRTERQVSLFFFEVLPSRTPLIELICFNRAMKTSWERRDSRIDQRETV